MQRRHKGLNTGVLFLLSQLYQVGFHNIPPVTLGTLAVNIFFFLQPLKPLDKACISVNYCLYKKDWHRLYLSAFHHADDWHLYFNMVSLLWKGIKLESRLGSMWFGYIIALFSLLVGAVYIFLEAVLAELLGNPSYEHHCAVGFSGVLFALKVLNNYYHPGGSTNIMGLNVSNKYSCWLELLAIHLLNPQSSFAGHLAGILVGLMYTMGPLKMFMTACAGGYSEQRNNYRTGNFRYSGNPSYPPNNYDMYTGGLAEEEQFERAEAIQGITVAKGGHMASGFHLKNYQLRNSEGRDLIGLRGGSSLKYGYKGLFIAVKTWWILFIEAISISRNMFHGGYLKLSVSGKDTCLARGLPDLKLKCKNFLQKLNILNNSPYYLKFYSYLIYINSFQ